MSSLPLIARLGLLACVALSSACAGGRAILRADAVGYPVSLSQAVFDSTGRTVTPGPDEVLGHFSIGLRQWTVFWGGWKLSEVERDLSDELRAEIESLGGNAIVNLTVEGGVDPYWYFTSVLLIIPTASRVTIEGDVVRIET